MATKQNMYVGANKEIADINKKIENAVIGMRINEDDSKSIGMYNIDEALCIREDVAEVKGELKILIKGLDSGSKRNNKYEKAYNQYSHFLNATNEERQKFLILKIC